MTLSIIIPAYNEEKNIVNILSSLKSLRIPHEVIVSDDKSTDGTVEIARQYADTVVEAQQKHRSIAANRNAGARIAQGEFLVFVDGSTIIENPQPFFERALAHFTSDSRLVALTGALWVYPEWATRTDVVVYTVFNWIHRLKNNILHMGESSGKFQMMRSSAFARVNGFREDLVTREDADMFNRLSKIGRTKCDPSLVVYHSGHRAHVVGWPKLLTIWMMETFWLAVFGYTKSKSWERWWEAGSKPRK